MDASIINAGIAWAVPVRPDLLGASLQAFEQCLPVLHALRLCNRFGQGPDAHITKLPTEVVLMVEDMIIEEKRSRGYCQWLSSFRHFERRCKPAEHNVHDEWYFEVSQGVRDDNIDNLCATCRGRDDYDLLNECDECRNMLDDAINEELHLEDDDGMIFEACENKRRYWEGLISQSPKGKFAAYDEILRKHFGLEVFFATTRIADGEAAPWPSDPNYKWHLGRALQTTICYLTLPRRAPGKATFSADEMEADYRSSTINAAQSYFIEIPSQQNRDLRSKQFQRALRTLRLKPYIHASQLNFTVSAEARSVAGLNPGTTGIANVEWPQLLMLVKANSNCPSW